MTGDGSPTEHIAVSRRVWRRRACLRAAYGVLLCAFGVLLPADAQTTDDTQLWLTVGTQGAVRGAYRVSAEVHARWRDDLQHYERNVLRLQGGRALTEHLTAWFGFEDNWPVAGRIPEELRLWQQVIYVQPAGSWALSHRARIEERFVDGIDRMVPRLRYSLRGTRPFHAESAWGAVLGAELFVQLRDAYRGGQPFPAGLDRDRVQAGISRRLTHALTLEPSYILQFVNAPTPLPNRREHVIQLQATHRF